jgi:hypothetical protein
MPKVSLFGIKIGNKSWKARKNIQTAKSVVKMPKTEDRNAGERRW